MVSGATQGGPGSIDAVGIKKISFYTVREPKKRYDKQLFSALYIFTGLTAVKQMVFGSPEGTINASFYLAILVGLQILTALVCHWSINVRCKLQLKPINAKLLIEEVLPRWEPRNRTTSSVIMIRVEPDKFNGSSEIVPIEKRNLRGTAKTAVADAKRKQKTDQPESSETVVYESEVSFQFRRVKYVLDSETGIFRRIAFPIHEGHGHYLHSTGFKSADDHLAALERWGPNVFEMPLPKFSTLMQEQLLAPFFVFQVFCVGLWLLDDYWYYSLFTLFMLVMFETTVAGSRLKSLRELRTMQTPKQTVQVYRGGEWSKVPGDALVPGDLISIQPPSHFGENNDRVVPADCLLVSGSGILDEAILTGESTPQWKGPLTCDAGNADTRLHIKRDKGHILFSGTKLLQTQVNEETTEGHPGPKSPDGGCVAVVLRTAFETEQGNLMRTILFSTERLTANNLETAVFILFLLVFALAASAYVLYHGLQDPNRSRFRLFLNCTVIITSVIPPELPMELTIAVNKSLLALMKNSVFCTEPFRIPLAGKIMVCCFDKTGTLTSDDMRLEGVAVPEGGRWRVVKDFAAVPGPAARVLTGCSSLTTLNGQVIGDPLEQASLKALGWALQEDGTLRGPSAAGVETLTIVARHHFNSDLKRMTVVLRASHAEQPGHLLVVTKGAPESLGPIVSASGRPADLERVYREHAAAGARVIALAFKYIKATVPEVKAMTRAQLECDLTFSGLGLFQTPLKPESEPVLRHLADAAHPLVMITGDAALTACHVAQQVHITCRPVLILNEVRGLGKSDAPASNMNESESEDEGDAKKRSASTRRASAAAQFGPLAFAAPDESETILMERATWEATAAQFVALSQTYDLCVTGAALHQLEVEGGEELLKVAIPTVQVFARVSPDQKELVVKTLRSIGRVTLMCGDGTNDMGGLKAADVGVALLAPPKRKAPTAPAAPTQQVQVQLAGQEQQPPGAPQLARTPEGFLLEIESESLRNQLMAMGFVGGQGTKLVAQLMERKLEVSSSTLSMALKLDRMEKEWGLDQMDADAVMVKPGDASMASPFTARADHVGPVLDILRQGRCTLVTTVQMFKILGLMCLNTAYSLSVMYLNGVKLGDYQATLQGILSTAMFFFLSNAAPRKRLSIQRPHPNILSGYVFLSVLFQSAAHLAFLWFSYSKAETVMDPSLKLTPDSEFAPNLVNTVAYLTNTVSMGITFAVNYVGEPFNMPLRENRKMFFAVVASGVLYMTLVTDAFPPLTESFSIVKIPASLQDFLIWSALGTFVSTFAAEHLLRRVFPARMPKDMLQLEALRRRARLAKPLAELLSHPAGEGNGADGPSEGAPEPATKGPAGSAGGEAQAQGNSKRSKKRQ